MKLFQLDPDPMIISDYALVDDLAICGICEQDLRRFDTFYDSRLKGSFTWVWVCKECHENCCCGVGMGLGQEYDSKTDKKLR